MSDVSIDQILKHFFIVAHRGFSGIYPENTMLSFKKAVEYGVDIVELDVRLTKDGTPIVFHDKSLKRLVGKPGLISDYVFKELSSFKIDGEKILSLSEALEYLVDHVGVFIEVKEDEAIKPIMDLIREHSIADKVAIISFSKYPLEYARRINPDIVTGLIYMKPDGGIVLAKEIGAKIVLPFHRLASSKSIAFAHRLGLKVVVWVINDADNAVKYIKRGVDGIATDYPDRILKILE